MGFFVTVTVKCPNVGQAILRQLQVISQNKGHGSYRMNLIEGNDYRCAFSCTAAYSFFSALQEHGLYKCK